MTNSPQVSMPREAFTADATIMFNHIDGPLLEWACYLHWLTFRERWSVWRGKETANTLADKHWSRRACINSLERPSYD